MASRPDAVPPAHSRTPELLVDQILAQQWVCLTMTEISRRRTDEFGDFVAVLKLGAVDFEDGARVPEKRLSRCLNHTITPYAAFLPGLGWFLSCRDPWSIAVNRGASFFFELKTIDCTVPIGIPLAAAISWYSHCSTKRSVITSRSRGFRSPIHRMNSKAGGPV